jgi:hypothetical protein
MDRIWTVLGCTRTVKCTGMVPTSKADPTTEAMVDAAHEVVWFDAFWAIDSRADFKTAVQAMIRTSMERNTLLAL